MKYEYLALIVLIALTMVLALQTLDFYMTWGPYFKDGTIRTLIIYK